jgi:hypothetical protein
VFDNKYLPVCNKKFETELHDDDLNIDRTAKLSTTLDTLLSKLSNTLNHLSVFIIMSAQQGRRLPHMACHMMQQEEVDTTSERE